MIYTLAEILHGDFPKDAKFVWTNDPNRERRIKRLEREIAKLRDK